MQSEGDQAPRQSWLWVSVLATHVALATRERLGTTPHPPPTTWSSRTPKDSYPGLGTLVSSLPHPCRVPAGPSHGRAFPLEHLAGYLGITKEDIAAFGDNTNDLPLLKAAGTSVAVANAVPQVKEWADYVAEGERSKGFTEGLLRYIPELAKDSYSR